MNTQMYTAAWQPTSSGPAAPPRSPLPPPPLRPPPRPRARRAPAACALSETAGDLGGVVHVGTGVLNLCGDASCTAGCGNQTASTHPTAVCANCKTERRSPARPSCCHRLSAASCAPPLANAVTRRLPPSAAAAAAPPRQPAGVVRNTRLGSRISVIASNSCWLHVKRFDYVSEPRV